MNQQPADASTVILRMLERVLDTQRPLVVAHLRSLRRKRPDLTPDQMLRRIEKQYLTAVSGGGAAVGATAAIPGIGTVSALGISAAETVGFLESTAFFAQAYTEIHGTPALEQQRAKALVMTLLLGSAGTAMVRRVADQSLGGSGANHTTFWGGLITQSLPPGVMQQLLESLRNMLVRRIATQSVKTTAGRLIPFGIGALFGGVGNHMLGRQVIASAHEAFGPAPRYFTTELDPRPNDRRDRRQLKKQVRRELREAKREYGLSGIVGRNRARRLEPPKPDEPTPSDD